MSPLSGFFETNFDITFKFRFVNDVVSDNYILEFYNTARTEYIYLLISAANTLRLLHKNISGIEQELNYTGLSINIWNRVDIIKSGTILTFVLNSETKSGTTSVNTKLLNNATIGDETNGILNDCLIADMKGTYRFGPAYIDLTKLDKAEVGEVVASLYNSGDIGGSITQITVADRATLYTGSLNHDYEVLTIRNDYLPLYEIIFDTKDLWNIDSEYELLWEMTTKYKQGPRIEITYMSWFSIDIKYK